MVLCSPGGLSESCARYRRQIERGLRKPSADVLSQIAKALRVSAEVLDVQAGTLEPSAVRDAIVTDAAITRC